MAMVHDGWFGLDRAYATFPTSTVGLAAIISVIPLAVGRAANRRRSRSLSSQKLACTNLRLPQPPADHLLGAGAPLAAG